MAQITTLERLAEIIPDPSPRAGAKVLDHLDEQATAFIAKSPFLMLATEGPDGIEVSPKGDLPGFVTVLDANTLLIPERSGNQLKMSLRNIIANGRIALIFLCPATGDAVRASGVATLDDDTELCAAMAVAGKPAKLVIRVAVDRSFFHCPKAILRSNLWQPESWGDPIKVSYGAIYAKALGKPEIVESFDAMSEQHNSELWT